MTPQEAIEAQKQFGYMLYSRTMKLEAHCLALESAILALGEKLDCQPDEFRAEIRKVYDEAFERALEKAEKFDPSLAGQLDDRPLFDPDKAGGDTLPPSPNET